MKISTLVSIIAFSLLASCAGTAPETDSTTTENANSTDSLNTAPAFTEFAAYVASLNPNLDHLDSAFAKYDALKINFSQEEKDSSFFVIREFMSSFEVAPEESEIRSEEDMKNLDKKYGKNGFYVSYNEGSAFLEADIKFLSQKFKKDISAELDDYVDILKKTFGQTTSDAGLAIEWSELADQIIACEEFVVENTDSKYKDEVFSLYEERIHFLMWGFDNTPIIDTWSEEGVRKVEESVSAVYQKLIKDDKHKTGKIIADHLAWMESKNFNFTWEDQQRLTRSEIEMYLGI